MGEEVQLIAAEDTRRTAKLLNHYGIHTTTTSFHEHNEVKKGAGLLRRITGGDSVAVVADAGTPLLSDPGRRLVQDALTAGIKVQAVPGPCAVLSGLVMSGLIGDSFSFVGFPPRRSKDRISWLKQLIIENRPVVMFESPHRIQTTAKDILSILGDRRVSFCREMTKEHEELVNGPISMVLECLSKPRGEYTIVIAPPDRRLGEKVFPSNKKIWDDFCHLTNKAGIGRREAIRTIAERYKTQNRKVYSIVEDEKYARSGEK